MGCAVLSLRFASDAVWRACCDPVEMQSRWGRERSRLISRRLQQLQAMASVGDLQFLPCASREHHDGSIEIALDDHVSLILQRGSRPEEDAMPQTTVTVIGLSAPSIAAQR